jgi:hypothetical protein
LDFGLPVLDLWNRCAINIVGLENPPSFEEKKAQAGSSIYPAREDPKLEAPATLPALRAPGEMLFPLLPSAYCLSNIPTIR